MGSLVCANSNPEDSGAAVVAFHNASRCVVPDLDHSWLGVSPGGQFQRSERRSYSTRLNDGFVRVNDASDQPDNGVETPTEDSTMGFYNQVDLPFYYDLAQKFAIDDRYFASVMGPTLPNRLYLMAGYIVRPVSTRAIQSPRRLTQAHHRHDIGPPRQRAESRGWTTFEDGPQAEYFSTTEWVGDGPTLPVGAGIFGNRRRLVRQWAIAAGLLR